MVGGFGEGLLRIVGYYEAPKGACESNVLGGSILLLQLGCILVVYVAGRPGTVKPSPYRAARRRAAGVKPPSHTGGWGFWIGSGVSLTLLKSKNSLLKVTVSPPRSR